MEPEKKYMQIGEVAERTGLTHRTLRYYEEKGLLKPPSRMEGGFRLYTDEDVQRILQIRELANLLGFSLAEIKEMVETDEVLGQLKAEYRQGVVSPSERPERLRKAIKAVESQASLIDQKVEQLSDMRNRLKQKLEHLRDVLRDAEKATAQSR